jgi:hypothetical protein
MKHLLLFFLLPPFYGAWAQDFRCIVPGEDRFYMDGNNMLGLRVIASDTFAEGIIHHFNHDLRPVGFNDPGGCNPYSSCDEMMAEAYFTVNGASWMGTHMMEYSDGMNHFFNLTGDTVRLNTLAGVGDSWVVFQWADGSRLDASVLSIAQENVLGVVQDVKTIGFQAMDAGGSMSLHPLNGEQWRLSRHNGLVQVHALYWFPDFPAPASQESVQCASSDPFFEHFSNGMTTLVWYVPPTEGEMFGMAVGDLFQFRTVEYGWDVTRYESFEVISRVWSDDTLRITFEVDHFSTSSTDVVTDTMIITVTDTSAIFPNGILPGQTGNFNHGLGRFQPAAVLTLGSDLSDGDEVLAELMTSCEISAIRADHHDNLFPMSSTPCAHWLSFADGAYGPRYHLSGIPTFAEFVIGQSGPSERVPIYVNTSTCQFGSRMYVGVEETARRSLTVHPNPASSVLRFDSPSLTDYTVMDASGRTVMQGQAQQGQNTLTVDGLRDGMYVLRLEDGSGAVRFVKVGQ